jgi:hypothetical protein
LKSGGACASAWTSTKKAAAIRISSKSLHLEECRQLSAAGRVVRREALSGRTSMAGLNTLLRRHIKPADLAATCWNEWLVTNGRDVLPERRARAEAILRDHGRQPLEAVRAIETVLHAKGPL